MRQRILRKSVKVRSTSTSTHTQVHFSSKFGLTYRSSPPPLQFTASNPKFERSSPAAYQNLRQFPSDQVIHRTGSSMSAKSILEASVVPIPPHFDTLTDIDQRWQGYPQLPPHTRSSDQADSSRTAIDPQPTRKARNNHIPRR